MIMVIPNLILCSFDIFDKTVFDFVGIQSIFFFLATILIMATFNF